MSAEIPVQAVPLNRRMITLSVMLATIIQTLDSTIANVALPHMQGSLSASADQITWVLTSYIVAAAIATPLTGWLCDRFTQKRVFLAAVAGFTFASLLCGVSMSLTEIVVARLLQGLCGAALVPLSQAVMLEINPPATRGSAMAMWGMGVMVGPILGPSLGGWLTDSYDWRWVFFINLPIGALAFWGIWRYIRPTTAARLMRFDVFGFATLSLAIGALQMLLDRGQDNDWLNSTETWVELLLFLVAAGYFIVHTWFTPPQLAFVDFRLLRNGNFVSGLLFIFIVGAVLYAVRALTPPMLQTLMNYPVMSAGLLMAPSGAGTMVAMLLVGRLVGKVDSRLLLTAGFSITAVSLWIMSGYTLVLSQSDILVPGVIQGFGLGLVFVPLSTLTFSTLEPAMFAQGTALYSLVRNIGSSIGISLVQTLWVRNTQVAHASLAEAVTATNRALQAQSTGGYDLSSTPGLLALNGELTRQAAMIAYLDDFKLMLALTVLVLPLLWLIKPSRKKLSAQEEEALHAAME
ncbi:DHA2 family efflux MFS transporter permease subunit [Pelomonas sp. KK5]|uniref:DHA2 family efflux MFS transporter permease subunit n=1 Tax=Pelomonas sp. KK5 TaxID=1855730 RepID=UPI00097BD18B|nr:DHA2 family efflux MFS transporter permease subunit [Pelomonas sp. KK5]